MPSKSRRRPLNASKFLFINQDAGSLLSSSGRSEVNQSKQIHVQRLYFARKREAALRALQETSVISNVSCDRLGESPDAEKAPELEAANLPTGPNIQRSGSDLVVATATYEQPAPPAFEARTPTSAQSPIIGLSNICHSQSAPAEVPRPRPRFCMDPFSSTTIEIHPAAPSLMQYYASNMIPAMFLADIGASDQSARRIMRAFQEDMRDCMADEGNMYALLSSTSAHMYRWQGQLRIPGMQLDANDTNTTLYFRTKTIAAVRKKLANGQVDVGLFNDIYRLMSAETILGDLKAAQAHFQALLAVTEALGGVDALDGYRKERIIHTDLYGATQSLRCPSLPLTWDPGNLPAETELKIHYRFSLSNLGSHFWDARISNLFHSEMQSILADLIIVVHMTTHSYEHSDLSDEELSWLSLKRSALDHRLLAFPTKFKQPGDHNFIQECTRIATLFWMGMTLPGAVCKALLAPFVTHLMWTLKRSGLQSLWYPHSGLLLWITTIGAFMADDESEYSWFATMTAKVAGYLQIDTELQLENLLQGFLYFDDIQHEKVTDLFPKLSTYLQASKTQVRCYYVKS